MIQMKFELHSIKMVKVTRSAILFVSVLTQFIQSNLSAKPPARVPLVYFKSYRCKFSETFVYKNYSCYAKSYSRTLSTLNNYILFKNPMNDIFVSKLQSCF